MLMVMKVFYQKKKANIVTYRIYKHFSNEAFLCHVKNRVIQMTFGLWFLVYYFDLLVIITSIEEGFNRFLKQVLYLIKFLQL